jgi:hypothetical protein
VFSFFSSVNNARDVTCATKTIQQPNERRACKNKQRQERLNVCADARAMSEKLLEQKSNSSFFWLSPEYAKI